MINKRIVIPLKRGFHIRPCSEFAKLAKTFACEVVVKYEEVAADGKSPKKLFALNAMLKNVEITIFADGDDEISAIEVLSALAEGGFRENS